jgi:dihydrofolate synthase / folylpolyglutamate synthase
MSHSRFDTLEQWLSWQESLHGQEIDLGLERIATVADRLQLRQPSAKVITVAGTNGKGSCVATLETLCVNAGISVGAFTSPHFLRYNERIRLDGEQATDEQICSAFSEIDAARDEISLTYFEFGALAAMLLMQRAGVDVMLLEVGLGGRLDAVNILDADIAVITSIDIDHQDWLGDNREQIGAEKAGVMRQGRLAICADPNPPESIRAVAERCGAHLQQRGESWWIEESGHTWSLFRLEAAGDRSVLVGDVPVPGLPLPSVAAALMVFSEMGYELPSDLAIQLQQLGLTGRAQTVLCGENTFVLDVAHNPAAAGYLANWLSRTPCEGQTWAVFGIMEDKDLSGVLTPLTGVIDRWLAVDLPGVPRASSGADLANALSELGADVDALPDVTAALKETLVKLSGKDRVIVLGSFFTVAAALEVLPSLEALGRG